MTETTLAPPPAAVAPGVGSDAAETARRHDLESELRLLGAQMSALQARFLAALADYDDMRGWAHWGARSAVDWLSNHCGHGAFLARSETALAHALAALPRIRAALERGALSMDKARAIAAVASPDTEEELLGFAAQATANQLARALAAARRALRGNQAEGLHRARQLHTYWDEEGALRIKGRLSPEEGALFRKALEAAREALYRQARSEGFEGEVPPEGAPDPRPEPTADAHDPYGAARADALMALARSFLGGEGTVPAPGGEHYQVVIHADAEVLVDDGEGRCHIEDGPALSAETVRRLACEGASLVWLAGDGAGSPVAISERAQHSLPRWLRRAVRFRDGGCVFPTGAGSRCGMPARYSHVHHVVHRAHGGAHSFANCRILCSSHHHLVHEGGFAMAVLDDGALEFRFPDGTVVPTGHPPVSPVFAGAPMAFEDLEPDGSWALSNGGPMDLGLAVDGLLGLGLEDPDDPDGWGPSG